MLDALKAVFVQLGSLFGFDGQKADQKWVEEPARKIAAVLNGVTVAVVAPVDALAGLAGILHGQAQTVVLLVVNTVGAAVVISNKIQAELTRAKVYAPMTVASDPALPPLEGTQPGPTPQGTSPSA